MRTVMPELAHKVDVKKECLVWTGCTDKDGYGVKRLNGKNHRTHRLNWEYANDEEIPKGMLILHTCDNPPCLLPSHLWLGTDEDNARDRADKGRSRGGRKNQEFCKRGHLMSESYFLTKHGKRQCRPCSVINSREARAKK